MNSSARHVLAEALEPRRLLSTTFTVTSNADAGAGTLRQALLDANATAGQDAVAFNLAITADPGSRNIVLASPLPVITDPVAINGGTQTKLTVYQVVQLVGNPGISSGLVVHADRCSILCLALTHFDDAVVIAGSDNRVFDCGLYRNRDTGVTVESGVRNDLGGNTLYLNARRGIDINAPFNDALDADTGPNERLNAPVITRAFLGLGVHPFSQFLGRVQHAPALAYCESFPTADSRRSIGFRFDGHRCIGRLTVRLIPRRMDGQ